MITAINITFEKVYVGFIPSFFTTNAAKRVATGVWIGDENGVLRVRKERGRRMGVARGDWWGG